MRKDVFTLKENRFINGLPNEKLTRFSIVYGESLVHAPILV